MLAIEAQDNLLLSRQGAIAAGAAFVTGTPDVHLRYTITLPTPSQQINIAARQLDSSNRWQIGNRHDGVLLLFETTGGSGNTRASAAGLTNGARVDILMRGSLFIGLINGLQVWSFVSESHMLQTTFSLVNPFDGAITGLQIMALSR